MVDGLMESLTVLAKVSESCPLRCIYCYEGNKSSRKMGEDTLANMTSIIESRHNVKRTTYIWHGAEPMTASIDFYRVAKRLQNKYNHVIKNGMQSSGVLLTAELADFFAEEDFDVGFSLDGPEYLHNQTRQFYSGRGTFAEVMNSIKLMRDRGKKPGVIAVLCKISLPHLDTIYDFFKENNLSFKINPVMNCGFAKKEEKLLLTLEERVNALTHLFDRWFFDNSDGHKVEYENMMSLSKGIFCKGGSACDMLPSCQNSFISVGTDGAVYPCSRFSDPLVSYGNINKVTDFNHILQHPLRRKLLTKFEDIPACKQCEYNFLCYSGCLHNSYVSGNIMQQDPNCLANRKVYEHIATKILEQLERDGALKEGKDAQKL